MTCCAPTLMSRSGLLSAVCLCALAGCASERMLPAQLARFTAQHEPQRNVKSSDKHDRVTADATTQKPAPDLLKEAEQLWRKGDAEGSRKKLIKLLDEQPDHRAARMMLADLYAAKNDLHAAEEQLERIVKDRPQDAQAHHSLGLVLEDAGRVAEALQHYDEACRLDPHNELFQLTRESCSQSNP